MVKRRKDGGFTLIELMIVIAVIGILAIVLVPKIGDVKTSAKISGVQTNYRSVTTIIHSMNDLKGSDDLATIKSAVVDKLEKNIGDMKNPITNATGVTVNGDNSNAAVIVLESTTLGVDQTYSGYAGAVVVSVSKDQANVISVDVYGVDDKGKPIQGLHETIKP